MSVDKLLNFYNSNLFNKVKKLTEPLNLHLNIDAFCYSITKPDGNFFQVTNVPELSEHYFSNYLFVESGITRNPEFYNTGFYVVDMAKVEDEDPGQKAMNNKFAIDNMLVFFLKEGEHCHNFVFSTNILKGKANNHYIENAEIIKKYCSYFSNEWKEYLSSMDAYTLNLREEMGETFDIRVPQFTCKPQNSETLFLDELRGYN